MSDEEGSVCLICGGTACDWGEFGEQLIKKYRFDAFLRDSR